MDNTKLQLDKTLKEIGEELEQILVQQKLSLADFLAHLRNLKKGR